MVAQTPNMDISLSNLDSHSLNSASFFFSFYRQHTTIFSQSFT